MVSITEEQCEHPKVRENGVAGCTGPGGDGVAMDTPVVSISNESGDESEAGGDDEEEIEVDYTRNYWEDEDDIYQEFEDLDFEALPDCSDTRSIASDDSFYPPDSSVVSLMRRSSIFDSPEPISFFNACCNNNAIIVKIMIRQGVTEQEVKETDRNRRVGVMGLKYLLECLIFKPFGLNFFLLSSRIGIVLESILKIVFLIGSLKQHYVEVGISCSFVLVD